MIVNTNLLEAIAAIASPVITLTGFILIYLQIKELKKSTLGGTYGALYAQQHSIHQFFIENPSFRAFFYGSQEIDHTHQDYEKVMAIAEMVGDFFEHIYLQKHNLPKDTWIGWQNYMLTIYQNSPALEEHFRSKRMWYGEKVVRLLKYAES
jgi:hypothetical protein